MPAAVAAVDDFFFQAKLKESAKALGATLVFSSSLEETLEAAAREGARLVIIDLDGRRYPRVEAVRALKADPRTKGALVVGYLPHVMDDLRAEAQAAGCDLVLARSAFLRRLPELLARA